MFGLVTFSHVVIAFLHYRPFYPSVCLNAVRIAGILLLYIKEQGAAGSAGPRGDWPGRARVRHHFGGGRLVSAWPKSKEDVCRASPCSPSLPTSLTLTHISRLSWTPTDSHGTAHLPALGTSSPRVTKFLNALKSTTLLPANEKSKLALPSR